MIIILNKTNLLHLTKIKILSEMSIRIVLSIGYLKDKLPNKLLIPSLTVFLNQYSKPNNVEILKYNL